MPAGLQGSPLAPPESLMLPQQAPSRVEVAHSIRARLLGQGEDGMRLGKVQPDNHEQFFAAQSHHGCVSHAPIDVYVEHIQVVNEPLFRPIPHLVVNVHTQHSRSTCHATNTRYANSARFSWAIRSDKRQVDKSAHNRWGYALAHAPASSHLLCTRTSGTPGASAMKRRA